MNASIPDDVLVLRACGSSAEHAAQAWEELHNRHGWDLLPHSLSRFLPQIYLNTRGASHVIAIDRLRGVYRSSWAANLTRAAKARAVVDDLRGTGVDATVIKGAAVCVLTDHWGFRRMGDIDMVVRPTDGEVLREALVAHGFRRMTPAVTGRNSDAEGQWRDDHGSMIDVHFGDRWSRYVGLTAAESTRRVSQGFDWSVPTPEAALAIALEHGSVGSSAGDLLQTTLDVRVLASLSDPEEAMRMLSTTRLASAGAWHARRLADALETTDFDWLLDGAATLPRPPAPPRRSRSRAMRPLLRRVREFRIRRLSGDDRRLLWRSRRTVGVSYWIWAETGMLGSVERLMTKLRIPPIPSTRRGSTHPHPGNQSGGSPDDPAAELLWRRDLRTRVDLTASGGSTARLRVVLPPGLEHQRFLFVGNSCKGLIDPRSTPVIDVDIDPDDSGEMDVSLRLHWDVPPRETVLDTIRVDWVRP